MKQFSACVTDEWLTIIMLDMEDFDKTLAQQPRPRFETTQWSLVIQAGHCSTPAGRDAFADLCQRYWYPLYAYVRSRGNDVHQAHDLTQGFFERVIEKNYIGDADPARGRFRTFLLTSLSNFLANEHDRRTALKRGGGQVVLSLDVDSAELRLANEQHAVSSAETQFQQQWARSLLDRVLDQLRDEYVQAGKAATFDSFKQFLTIGEPESADAIASRLSMTASAVRVAIHRLRSRYRSKLRSEIAATVDDPDEVDEEIAALFEVFSN